MQSRSRYRALWPFVPYVLMSLIHVISNAVHSPLTTPTKALLMPLLALPLALGWKTLATRGAAVLLAAALFFSWLGDEAGLFFPLAPELPLMLGFFGVAHVAYIVLFLRRLRVRRLPLWTVAYVLWWLLMMMVLGPHTGSLLVAVGAYGVVLAGTAATSAGCRATIAWGGAFFLASDSILAFRLFLPDAMPDWTSPAVMVTYTIGQGLIVAGALRALHRDDASLPAAVAGSRRSLA
ncbi:YhhN-like protein [Microbacterium sp. 8M]|uniref:lysoplasmalogenase family protein n=1 Tax=Microbacterium sp. 8M TaxID=2653153 RepID=UPI0012EF4C37|nr:lysoplasmalogenase family protein [Microbacterium sp. 8M]VXC10555.1 YhhN-like protein [Microbacterium sp. 8M]